jgi:hypothetical protein
LASHNPSHKRTKPVKDDEGSQRERFEQTARELGVDLDEEKLKEALRRVGSHKSGKAPTSDES